MLTVLEEHSEAMSDLGVPLTVDKASRMIDGIPVSGIAQWVLESQPWIIESHGRCKGSNAGKRSKIYVRHGGKELEDDLLSSAEALHGLPLDASAWEKAVRSVLAGKITYIGRTG